MLGWGINDYASIKLFFKGVHRMVGTSMPCTETIDGWIPGIDAQPWTPKEEINASPTRRSQVVIVCLERLVVLRPKSRGVA